VILDLQINKVPGSNADLVTLEFYDKNVDNYFNRDPVTSPLRSDVLTDRKDTSELNSVRFYDTSADSYFYYYTALKAKVLESDIENAEQFKLNGQTITARTTTRTRRSIVLYLTDSATQTFKQRMAKAGEDTSTDSGDRVAIGSGGAYYTSIEVPDMAIERISGGIDLNRVQLTVTTAINDNNKYT